MVKLEKKHFSQLQIIIGVLLAVLVLLTIIHFYGLTIFGNVIIEPTESSLGNLNRAETYEELVNAFFVNENVTKTVNDSIWVPWFSSSTDCKESALQHDSACNLGTVDFSQNCMVSDEFSQLGILLSMNANQTRMDQFYNTLDKIKSSNGVLPSWRSYINNSEIVACGEGINDNCDTASDADARIMIALYTASRNSLFKDENKKQMYLDLANDYAQDFVKYEIVNNCYNSSLGYGQICYWLAAGSESKRAGLTSTDFGYTGYYPDAIIAMLQACSETENVTYCYIARNLTLNYLEASKFDNETFTVPPGRSFRWTNLTGIPSASCTNNCNPAQWDDADAPRALGLCQTLYYSSLINISLPGLENYCSIWRSNYLENTNAIPYQYLADGTPGHSYQSGYFAQGLQSLAQFGTTNYIQILDNALAHYSITTKTWDSTSCSGIYRPAFVIRSLGTAIGRDLDSFTKAITLEPVTRNSEPTVEVIFLLNDSNSTNENTTNTSQTPTNSPIDNTAVETASSGGGGGGGGSITEVVLGSSSKIDSSCTPDWECQWDTCRNGLERPLRCIDNNYCNKLDGKPTEKECVTKIALTDENNSEINKALLNTIKLSKSISINWLILGIVVLIFLIAMITASKKAHTQKMNSPD